jgi:RimJ/RimL family protein N-acetyltransferase
MAANPAMIHVFEKLGFQQEGVLRSQDELPEGGYGDHILLGCLKSEFVRGQAEALREGDEDARK